MQYALLAYSTYNLGDEIQSLAARQFLPRVDYMVNRDRMQASALGPEAFLIANGWFSHAPENFPPPPNLHPFWISFPDDQSLVSIDKVNLPEIDSF